MPRGNGEQVQGQPGAGVARFLANPNMMFSSAPYFTPAMAGPVPMRPTAAPVPGGNQQQQAPANPAPQPNYAMGEEVGTPGWWLWYTGGSRGEGGGGGGGSR